MGRALSLRNGQTVIVRVVVGVAALMGALALLGGPLFGLVVLASGGDLYVSGGALRLAFDLVVGFLLLHAATTRLALRSRTTAA